MGKTTGFLDYARQETSSRPPEERVRDWEPFHIPLQKPVHLTPCSHIGAYLLYNPLLSTCEREREKLAIKIIEELPDTRKTETLGGG